MKRQIIAAFLITALLSGCAAQTKETEPELPEPEPDALAALAPEPDQSISDIEPDPKPEPEPETAPMREPEPEPTVKPEPEPTTEPEPEPEEEPKPEPTVDPIPEPVAATEPDTAADPEPEPIAEPVVDPEPAADPEPDSDPDPEPEPQVPHISLEADGLYYIQEDGSRLTEGTVGYLHFGPDGRYTCGDAELDEQVRELLAGKTSGQELEPGIRLREIYDYISGPDFGYLGLAHYPAGSSDWINEAAAFIIKNGKSNCYGFAALFCLCARELGYQAYVVAGYEYSVTNEHAWVMIDWPDGQTYLFDPQLDNKFPNCDTFLETTEDGVYYDGHAYYFP